MIATRWSCANTRRMIGCVLLGVLATMSLAPDQSLAGEPQPPKPDPANPVDYIDWINKNLGGASKNSAHTDYLAAYAKLPPLPEDMGAALEGPWAGNQPLADWLKANAGALTRFRHAAAKRDCFFPVNGPQPSGDARRDRALVGVLLPELKAHRAIVKALVAEGWQAWARNDQQLLLRNATTILKSAQHLEDTPFLIWRLVSVACKALAYQTFLNALKHSSDPDELASEILRQLKELERPRLPFARACLVERLTFWDSCQRLFVPGKSANDWSLYDPVLDLLAHGESSVDSKKAAARIGFEATLREGDAYFDAVEQWVQTPYARAAEPGEAVERVRTECKNPISTKLLPSLQRARALDERLTALGRGVRLVTAIFECRRTKGGFPAALDELGPAQDQERVDPFSGKAFVYRKMADGFTLYSISENGKDDGGNHNPKADEGDIVYWPVQAQR